MKIYTAAKTDIYMGKYSQTHTHTLALPLIRPKEEHVECLQSSP